MHQHQTQLEIASHNWYKVTALTKEISSIDSIMLSDINWDILKTINVLILKKINFPHIEYKIPLDAYTQEHIRGLVELKESKQVVEAKTKAEIVKEIQALNLNTKIKTSSFYITRLDRLTLILKDYVDNNTNTIKIDEDFTPFIQTLILYVLINEEYNHYIFKNYEEILHENDKLFIRNFYAKREYDFNLQLFNIDAIQDQLKDNLFNSIYTFNYYIILYLSKRNIIGLKI